VRGEEIAGLLHHVARLGNHLAVLAANLNSRTTFSHGDFNYNGTVDIGDFAILAAKFNQSLPAARRAPAGPSRVFGGRLISQMLDGAGRRRLTHRPNLIGANLV
jgi:hypothetical protein